MTSEPPNKASMTEDVGLSNPDYHRHKAISKSKLDLIEKSPAHYWARYEDPNREEPEPTKAMVIGSAFHTYVLEHEKFSSEYVVAPSFNKRTKQGKEDFAAFVEQSKGKTALLPEEMDKIIKMAQSVRNHPSASKLLELKGKAEQTFMWKDNFTNLECKCRPDWHLPEQGLVVDLKTTEDASPDGFSRSIHKFRYHCQSAWYLRGTPEAEAFIFIAVEKTPPFAVVCYQADAAMVAAGQRAVDKNLNLLASCMRVNVWPSYSSTIETLSLPRWNND